MPPSAEREAWRFIRCYYDITIRVTSCTPDQTPTNTTTTDEAAFTASALMPLPGNHLLRQDT